MAFHPYPQVIPSVFNRSGFGPPRGLTPASACPWIAHPASRLRQATMFAILKARFHCGSVPTLTSPLTATRWLILQKARRHAARALRLLVGIRFQVLFHSPLGVLFTFPSRYWFAIGHKRVFSLREWSPWIHTGFHVSGITRVSSRRRPIHFAYRTITFSGRTFQTTSTMNGFCNCAWEVQAPTKTTPRHHMQQRPETYTCMGLGYLRVRSPLLAQSRLISFPPGT